MEMERAKKEAEMEKRRAANVNCKQCALCVVCSAAMHCMQQRMGAEYTYNTRPRCSIWNACCCRVLFPVSNGQWTLSIMCDVFLKSTLFLQERRRNGVFIVEKCCFPHAQKY
jgi:hypothetical protein